MNTIERRYVSGIDLRAERDGQVMNIDGYAALFNSLSEDLGGFRERIAPGTFSHAIEEKADVLCLYNHDPNIVLGRTTSETLRLDEDSTGLHFRCDLPDTQAARDLHTSIARSDIRGCSFAFMPVKDQWSPDNRIRTLLDVDLRDVSPVTVPAYPGTSVAARSLLWPGGVPENLTRALREPTKGISYVFLGAPKPAPPFRYVDPVLEDARRRARLRLAKLRILE